MKSLIVRLPLAAAVVLTLANCKSEAPALTGRQRPEQISFAPSKPIPADFSDEWTFGDRETKASQEADDGNTVKLQFQVGQDGKSVNDLKERDFRVLENGINVKQFKVAGDVEKIENVADIAFIVDMTTSMKPFIADAKKRLVEFINDTKGYHVRMCLSTFGDYTVQHCDKFYDSITEREAFIARVSELQAADRNFDPGYSDLPENPFRALVDAANKAAWGKDNQHFAILVTDDAFQYPEGLNSKGKTLNPHGQEGDPNFGKPEFIPPRLSEVNQAIAALNLRVFTVTKPYAGYIGEFDGQPGVAKSGQFFDFDKCRKTSGCLNTILLNILKSINTTYEITYNVAKNGLPSTLTADQRKVEVTTPKGTVGPIQKSVSNASGRAEYKQTFKVDEQPIQPDKVVPYINGVPVARNEFEVQGGNVIFKELPPPGAQLRFTYQYKDIAKNFNRKPLLIKGRTNASTTKVIMNGKPARPNDLRFEYGTDGNTLLNVNDSALADDDYYGIRKNNGLKIRVISNL